MSEELSPLRERLHAIDHARIEPLGRLCEERTEQQQIQPDQCPVSPPWLVAFGDQVVEDLAREVVSEVAASHDWSGGVVYVVWPWRSWALGFTWHTAKRGEAKRLSYISFCSISVNMYRQCGTYPGGPWLFANISHQFGRTDTRMAHGRSLGDIHLRNSPGSKQASPANPPRILACSGVHLGHRVITLLGLSRAFEFGIITQRHANHGACGSWCSALARVLWIFELGGSFSFVRLDCFYQCWIIPDQLNFLRRQHLAGYLPELCYSPLEKSFAYSIWLCSLLHSALYADLA